MSVCVYICLGFYVVLNNFIVRTTKILSWVRYLCIFCNMLSLVFLSFLYWRGIQVCNWTFDVIEVVYVRLLDECRSYWNHVWFIKHLWSFTSVITSLYLRRSIKLNTVYHHSISSVRTWVHLQSIPFWGFLFLKATRGLFSVYVFLKPTLYTRTSTQGTETGDLKCCYIRHVSQRNRYQNQTYTMDTNSSLWKSWRSSKVTSAN